MSYTTDDHDRAKSEMLGEFNKAIAGAEDLRKAPTADSDGGPAAVQGKTEAGPDSAGVDPAGAPGTIIRFSSDQEFGMAMAIDIQQLAMQIYVQTVSPGIMDRVVQGSSLQKLFKGAAENSIAAAEEFARVCEQTTAA
jgi:hypothetical protein